MHACACAWQFCERAAGRLHAPMHVRCQFAACISRASRSGPAQACRLLKSCTRAHYTATLDLGMAIPPLPANHKCGYMPMMHIARVTLDACAHCLLLSAERHRCQC